jgi:hypothetical protein
MVAKESFDRPVEEPAFSGTNEMRSFVPILYRRTGRGDIFGFPVILFSVTYRK